MESLNLLTQQVQLLDGFLTLLTRETDVLMKGTPQEVEAIVQEKRLFQDQLADVELARLSLMGDMTLKEYAMQTEYDVKSLIEQYQDLLPRIAKTLENNQMLIEMGLNHYQHMMNMISSAAKENVNTYGKQGQINQSEVKTASLLNRQA